MAKFRDHYFERETTVADAATKIIDLNVKDPISYITVEYEATTGATSCKEHEIHDDIESIEIMDGSDVICSLDMQQWRALNFYENKKLPHAVLNENPGVVQEERCVMQFGRFKDDMEFYLDPTKFSNPQIRLKHSLDISATAGYATGTGKITVMGRLIEEGAQPYQGYLMAKEVVPITVSASGIEVINMPRDFPYRALLIQARYTLLRPDEVISRLKLSCDADREIPFDMYMEDLMDMNEQRFGLAEQMKDIWTKDSDTCLTDIYDIRKAYLYSVIDKHLGAVEALDAEKVTIGLYTLSTPTAPAAITSEIACKIAVEGIAPHGIVCVPFGDMNDADSWFDPRLYGDVELKLTKATTTGAVSVMLQQLRV